MASHLCALPDEVLALCLGALGASELSALACTARRYLAAARADALWKPLFTARFEQPSRLASAAAQRAGGWAKLFADCAANEKLYAPWTTPPPFLLSAYVAAMCGERDDQLALLFLVDGSGSVTEEDFNACRRLMVLVAEQVSFNAKLGVLQFSNDVREEVRLFPAAGEDDDTEADPCAFDATAFSAAVAGITRLNGGTNITAALRKAASLLASPGAARATRRVVVLLTDGRVDGAQAREAAQRAARLADEQAAHLFALGVGRGADAAELLRIVAAGEDQDAAKERYLDLRTLDEPDW